MTWAEEVAEVCAAEGLAVEVTEAFADVTVDVGADDWVRSLTVARDRLGLGYFDWLSAVDEQAEGFRLVCHLYDVERHRHVLLRTSLPAEAAEVETATGVFRGAAWHERETHEMFGIGFDGHPYLATLLLPDGFEGHPLRKDFVLAARAAKAWPGAKEPGESDGDGPPSRRKTLPRGPRPQDLGSQAAHG